MLKQIFLACFLIMGQTINTQHIGENQINIDVNGENQEIKIQTENLNDISNSLSPLNTNLLTQNLQLSSDLSENSLYSQQNSNINDYQRSQQQQQFQSQQQTVITSHIQTNKISTGSPQVGATTFAQKFYFYWLNNNGSLLTFHEDSIRMEISIPQISQTIVCENSYGYKYRSGTTQRFTNFWVPVVDQITIKLIQYNFLQSNDVVNVQHTFNLSKIGQIGYYSTAISLAQFRAGQTLDFNYQGYTFALLENTFTSAADYYFLTELTSSTVTCCDQMSLPSTCYLSNSINLLNKKKILYLIALMIIMIFY